MTVLTIAGSDSGGGAGVQASLRTFAALGVSGASVVTAITAQNSLGVRGVWPVAPEQLGAQLEAVGTDFALGAVQIGMLGSAAGVDAVADFLARFRPAHVVLDPVLASTGGTPLLDDAGRSRLIERLLPLVDLVTPNLPEASALSGLSVEDDAGMRAAGRWFLERGARAVLVKSGHSQGHPRDLLMQADQPPLWIEGQRVQAFGRSGGGFTEPAVFWPPPSRPGWPRSGTWLGRYATQSASWKRPSGDPRHPGTVVRLPSRWPQRHSSERRGGSGTPHGWPACGASTS